MYLCGCSVRTYMRVHALLHQCTEARGEQGASYFVISHLPPWTGSFSEPVGWTARATTLFVLPAVLGLQAHELHETEWLSVREWEAP